MFNHLCPDRSRCGKTESDMRQLRTALFSHARQLGGQVATALKQPDRDTLIRVQGALQEHAALRKAMAPYVPRERLVVDLEHKIRLVTKALDTLASEQEEGGDA